MGIFFSLVLDLRKLVLMPAPQLNIGSSDTGIGETPEYQNALDFFRVEQIEGQ